MPVGGGWCVQLLCPSHGTDVKPRSFKTLVKTSADKNFVPPRRSRNPQANPTNQRRGGGGLSQRPSGLLLCAM
eukprot:2006-Amphidinium_carterae.1